MRQSNYWIAIEDGRPLTARKIVQEIHDKAEFYAAQPTLGQRQLDFPEGWLYFMHKRWVILYRPCGDGLDVPPV